MPTYTVKSPIKYKGERIQPGETVDMPEKSAAPAIAAGALEAPAEKKADKKDK